MDLRSIINTDAGNAPRPQSSAQSQTSPVKPHASYPPQPSPYQERYLTRPTPPPIQPPSQADLRSPPVSSAHPAGYSPYQTPSSAHPSSAGYPFPHLGQSPSHGAHPQPHQPRDGPAATTPSHQPSQYFYSQPSAAPFTPGGSHPSAVHHSPATPGSAHGPTPFNPIRESSLNAPGPHYGAVYQPSSHSSQPSTPLGPPNSHPQRVSSNSTREQHSPYNDQRSRSGGSYGLPVHHATSPPTHHPVRADGHNYGSVQGPVSESDRSSREYHLERERERSLSVSPKTVPPLSRHVSTELRHNSQESWNGHVTPAKRKQTEPIYPGHDEPLQRRSGPDGKERLPSNGSLIPPGQGPPPGGDHFHANGSRSVSQNSASKSDEHPTLSPSPTSGPPLHSDRPTSLGRSASGNSTIALNRTTSPPPSTHQQSPSSQDSPGRTSASMGNQNVPPPGHHREPDHHSSSAASPPQPLRKRPRYDEPPIFARKASRSTSSSPLMPNRRQPNSSVKQEPRDQKPPPPTPSQAPPNPPSVQSEENGAHAATEGGPTAPVPRAASEVGLLGPWEPSFIGVVPYEEVTRVVSNFLFGEVVMRQDVGTSAAGAVPGQGAQLEIEAKLGQLIDKHTNQRLHLPVMSECIIAHDDPSVRFNFRSSMTESQHRALNEYLNKAVVNSQPGKDKSRIPMNYVHTWERDTFYELSSSAHSTLPPSIRAQLNPRHKVKVRVTTDQKTGKVLAKIVKARVADLNVYSPRTAFDWRVSVNLEMNYEGDIDSLVESREGGRRTDRNKDRVSYKHLAYQIDLTQVTPFEAALKTDKEHELEVEVSSAELRKHGQLARENKESQYEDLVRGFVDNVRVLARVIEPRN